MHTGISSDIGYAMHHNSHVLKMDGKTVFCIESDILAYSDASYTSEEYVKAQKDKFSRITYYYGYTTSAVNLLLIILQEVVN